MYSSGWGRFGYMAGFGDLGLWLGYRVLEDVFLYGSYVLPGPVILFALGLYVVNVQGGCSVDNGSGDVGISVRDRNSACWPGFNCFNYLALWALLKYCF